MTYFLYSDYQFLTMYQKKQREIDANPSAFKEKYAIEYYQQWCIDSFQTALFLYDRNHWTATYALNSFFYESLETLMGSRNHSIPFIKIIGDYRNHFDKFISTAEKLICLKAVKPIPEYSIVSKFGFEYSTHLPAVQRLR
jgi:hypothetical protein